MSANDGGPGPPTAAEVDPYEVFEDDDVAVLCAEELARLCERLEYFVTATRVWRPGRLPTAWPAELTES